MWNWNIAIISAITTITIISILILAYTVSNARSIDKHQKAIKKVILEIKKGDKVMFSGGIIGIIEDINNDIIKLRILDNTLIEASIYSINNILN